MKYWIAAVLILSPFVVPAAVAAEPPLTAAEKTSLEQAMVSVEQQCQSAVERLNGEAAKNNGGSTPAWVSKLTSGSYCTCVHTAFVAQAPPELIRHGTQADAAKLLSAVGSTCAADNFKALFPEICRSWAQPLIAHETASALTESDMQSYCACAQPSADRITGDTLAATLVQTLADYKNVQNGQPPDPANRPLSIVGPMNACAQKFFKPKGAGQAAAPTSGAATPAH